MSKPRAQEGAIGRRTWRSRGIRLNTDATIPEVRMTNRFLSGNSGGSPSTVSVQIAEWAGTLVAAKTLQLPEIKQDAADEAPATEESSLDLVLMAPYNRRLLQEVHFLGTLRHPHLAQVYGLSYDHLNRPVIVSELLAESLQQRIAFAPRFSFRDVVDICAELLSALVYVHSLPHPVVHGSVCSANVLLAVDGTAKLTDTNFCLARFDSPFSPVALLKDEVLDQESGDPRHGSAHSSNAKLYLPAWAIFGDSYKPSVDCASFLALFMAMCLHREPRPMRPFDEGGRCRPEAVRREQDLNSLSTSGPGEAWTFMSTAIRASADKKTAEENDTNQEQNEEKVDGFLSSLELQEKVQQMKTCNDYKRSPTTRGSPAACAYRQQSDLEAAVRRLQSDVAETLALAEQAMKEEEAEMRHRLEEVEAALRAEKQAVETRLSVTRQEIERVEKEKEEESKARKEAEEEIKQLQAEIEALKKARKSPRLASRRRSPMRTGSERDNSLLVPGESLEVDHENDVSPAVSAVGYPIDSQDDSEYMCYLTVKMPDHTIDFFKVDERYSVDIIVGIICEHVGISEWEEYSLLVEEGDSSNDMTKKESEKNRSRSFKSSEKKQGSVKRKWNMSESRVNWLQHDRTLGEQGIDPNTRLLTLKKKLTVSIKEVSEENLEELQAEYENCCAAVLDSTCPCPLEEACILAALQLYVVHGSHGDVNKQKLKAMQEEVKEHLPRDFHKNKNAFRRVMTKYSELEIMTLPQAQARFIKLVKGLPTYGATLFLVKEKVKSKKLAPCIIGISRRAVVKLEEKSKELLEVWPFTSIRKWKCGADILKLDLVDTDTLIILTPAVRSISNILSKYLSIHSKRTGSHHEPFGSPEKEDTLTGLLPRSAGGMHRSASVFARRIERPQISRRSAEAPARASMVNPDIELLASDESTSSKSNSVPALTSPLSESPEDQLPVEPSAGQQDLTLSSTATEGEDNTRSSSIIKDAMV